MYKVKISIMEDNLEKDYIVTNIPTWNQGYSVIYAIVNSLYLILRRNFNYNNDYIWLMQQLEEKVLR